jgi:CYTH domain-containing protein
MAIEIERKFLVSGDFQPFAKSSAEIIQSYLYRNSNTSTRVRLSDERGWICIKCNIKDESIERYEYEYEIPVEDARQMLKLGSGYLIEKKRYQVHFDSHTWEVDVFHGMNEGLIIAEIELEHEDETISLPSWVGREVSNDQKYLNANLSIFPFRYWNSEDRAASMVRTT